MTASRRARLAAAALAAAVAGWAGNAGAGDKPPAIDLDAWHLELGGAGGAERDQEADAGLVLGVNPSCSAVLGFPNLLAYQGNVYLSLSDRSRFSVFIGYGVEGGSSTDATIYTLGWGGVRELPMVKPQLGFYGKFLRYRRWEDDHHGVHDGVSFGTESGAGALGLRFEIGAARSHSDHWLAVAQIAFTVELPIAIPLT
ncbi:MAG TPA: hypothetical protein PKJ99_03430 [Thermoanaerobaculales bacterium]|nr:hypothetical protein [Thermoanaerobaculales bacterium]HPA81960.1 hypothetical protein [Thermoanaerobaculales bacterium]HQL31352.1 hypothetical protein [Thermoanaerobaculales bacterium]HQN96667.1 hypothetical protein [Thermoanaerobaculales bacterium]HQP43528.1 hypothetical protein [Thermoanaerobaculales bacterium]